jgi:hypothetical protein
MPDCFRDTAGLEAKNQEPHDPTQIVLGDSLFQAAGICTLKGFAFLDGNVASLLAQ